MAVKLQFGNQHTSTNTYRFFRFLLTVVVKRLTDFFAVTACVALTETGFATFGPFVRTEAAATGAGVSFWTATEGAARGLNSSLMSRFVL